MNQAAALICENGHLVSGNAESCSKKACTVCGAALISKCPVCGRPNTHVEQNRPAVDLQKLKDFVLAVWTWIRSFFC